MGVVVFAADEQSSHPVDTIRWIRLAEAVLAAEGVRGDTEVSLLFVDEDAIADLNSRFLGREGPTDVLAFPMEEGTIDPGPNDLSGGEPTLLGDVVLCPEVAEKQAVTAGHSTADELHLLTVHGVLHLLGYDHAEPDEEREMFSLQAKLLDGWRAGRRS